MLAASACGDGGGFPDARLPDSPVPGGTMSLRWNLTDPQGQAITCNQIAAQTVTLILRNRDVQGANTEVFVCASGEGTTPLVAPGTYDVQYELASGAAGLIAQATTQMGVVVESGQNTELMPVTFVVDPTGGLDLRLQALKPGATITSNCAPTAQMGAGIQTMTITLTQGTTTTCEPVTFMLSNPPATYTVNCGSPQSIACIEKDRALTVMGVASGGYQIHIRGKIGAADCYTNDDSLQVPPAGKVLERTLNLGYQMGTPGC